MNPTGLARAVAGGYIPPRERESCKTCRHGEMRYPTHIADYQDRRRIYCSIHSTDLNLGGWCPKYERT